MPSSRYLQRHPYTKHRHPYATIDHSGVITTYVASVG